MTLRPAILSLGLALAALQPTAFAQPAAVTPIERANADAVARLYAAIAAEQVGDVSVATIVDHVNGYPIVMGGLARAEQIGGPRQVADEVVQVRLQISGARASQLILQAVAARPERSPVSQDRLAYLLRAWGDRTFASTGDNVEPPTVSSQPVAVDPTMVQRTMQQPLIAQPASPVDPPRDSAPANWRRAPAWVGDPIVAKASAPSIGAPLRTARAAEQAARRALRDQLLALPASDEGAAKLGDDLDKRPDVAALIDEAAATAKVAGVDYRGDGSVEVRVAAQSDRLWQRLVSR